MTPELQKISYARHVAEVLEQFARDFRISELEARKQDNEIQHYYGGKAEAYDTAAKWIKMALGDIE